MNAVFMLYRRHAKAVRKVMLAQMKDNLEALYDDKLPKNCLLSAAYRKGTKISSKKADTKRKKKKHSPEELNNEVKNRLAGNLKLTYAKLAESIGNTTPDSVRQTKAWLNRKKSGKK